MNNTLRNGSWFFYLLFVAALASGWYFHRDATRFNDRTEIWSDRAGYYIYLPATFFYQFDARKMPADLDMATGAGFSIDTARNKLETKYTYGVALMLSPFFLASHAISVIAGLDDEQGFSMVYVHMMDLAAVIYLMLGLWFLKKFLDNYFSQAVGYFVIAFIFLGTNLFYYSVIDGLMSHVYSFFLFSLFLFLLKKFLVTKEYRYFPALAFTFSLAVLVRPTNLLIGVLFFAWDSEGLREWMERLKTFLRPKFGLVFLEIIALVFLPQMLYWNYLSGHLVHFSYGDEGFSNSLRPRIAEVLFSPVNGLFTWTPLALLFAAGTFLMILRRRQNGWPVLLILLCVVYICGSWKMWYFGCSYGQRSFIEYYALLAVPFGWLTTSLFRNTKAFPSMVLFFLLFLFTWFNLQMSASLYRFERCYYGSTWDWDHYHRTLERAGILSPVMQMQSYRNDFENMALSPVVKPSQVFTRSGGYSIAANGKGGFTPLYTTRLVAFGHPFPKTMRVEAWLLKPSVRPTGAMLAYTLSRGTEVVFGDNVFIDDSLQKPLAWQRVSKTFIIPDVFDSTMQISVFVANPRHVLLYADDLKMRFQYRWNP